VIIVKVRGKSKRQNTDVSKGNGIEVQALIHPFPLHQILGIQLIRLAILAHQVANNGM